MRKIDSIEKKEKSYLEYKRLGQMLGVPVFEAFLELEVRDKDGKVIYSHKQRSHSWVRNAYNFMFTYLACKNPSDSTYGAGLLSAKDTGGTVRYNTTKPFNHDSGYSLDSFSAYYISGLLTIVGEYRKGIVIGTGTNVEDFEDYILQTQIANGTGAGQMSYNQSVAHSVAYDAGTKTLTDTLERHFDNNSGGSITVNEVGIYCGWQVSTTLFQAMTVRDKLASGIAVPDAGILKVIYEISLVYPA